ncbi:hypothetical protein QQ045_007128 [Rhodiola kirilowii]
MVDQDAHDHDHIHYDSRITGSAAKKKFDHHKRSKIRTAQGLRDRRVRLSIGIARKFFDLQDLLGFDKPSKTVEWLFTKSNKAILELTAASSSSTISPNKEAAVLADHGYKISLSSPRITPPTCSTTNHIDHEQVLCATKQKAALLAKDSREKARARARARTVAKLCTSSKLDHQNIRLPQVEINCDLTSSAYDSEHHHHFSSPILLKSVSIERQNEEIRKRIIIEHQLQKQQQLQPYNYYTNGLNTNMSIDWDIGSVIPQPSSSANQRLNMTRDIEIYSRSNWDHYRTL